MKKYLIALTVLVACILCFVWMPTEANAEELPELPILTVASGTCGAEGENLTWTLDDEGTLTISGTGAMIDYKSAADTPWYSLRAFIKSVVIEDDVTSIGYRAFENFEITSVTIGSGVKGIGYWAFGGCTTLEEVHITDLAAWCTIQFGETLPILGLPDVDEYVRYYLGINPLSYAQHLYLNGELVTELIIPDGVSKISNSAFANYDKLTSVTIPDSVTEIGYEVFVNCTSLTSVTIPDSVTEIGSCAFLNCTSLKSITIPNGVTNIRGSLFGNCASLTSVTIPNSVTHISGFSFSGGAFEGCTSLTNVTYCGTAEQWAEIEIDSYNEELLNATLSCHSATNATCIPCTCCGLPLGHTVVYGICTTCQRYGTCGENLTWTLGSEGTLTISGVGAMYDYSILPPLPGEDPSFYFPAWYGFSSNITNVVVQDGVTSIGENAFWDCTSLTSVTIPDSVTSIGWCAFDYCTSLTNITIPDSVTSIGRWAFSGCTSLSSVTYCGTAEQWAEIEIGSDNEELLNANRNYHNATGATCTTSAICTICGAVVLEAPGHSYDSATDADCNICGAIREVTIIFDETLTIPDKSMLLGGYIGAQFEVDMDAVTAGGYEYVYIIVTVNGEEYMYDVSLLEDLYIFEHRVAPKDMGVNMQITAYGVKDGVVYYGNTEVWSIKDGIMERLEKFYPYIKYEQYKNRCVLLVDMLYYGAAAQATLNETNESLVTDGLDQKYIDLRTTLTPIIEKTNTNTTTAKDQLYQVNLGVEDAVQMQLLFRLSEEDYSKYVVKITNGKNVYEYTGKDFVPEASSAKFVNLIFDKLEATDMRDVVIVELWKDGTQISASYELSIEGFANSYIQAGKYVDLLQAMITYGDSAVKSLG